MKPHEQDEINRILSASIDAEDARAGGVAYSTTYNPDDASPIPGEHSWQHDVYWHNPEFEPNDPRSGITDQLLLLTGAAGGGKSRVGLELLHRYMSYYPGATGIMLRKKAVDAGISLVPFLKHTVIPESNSKAVVKLSGRYFDYPNDSILYWRGMKDDDQREAVRSIGQRGGVDIILIEEANAFSWLDFQELLARLRGTAGDFRQVILMTNPDAPTHWINEKLILGGLATVVYSGAQDNAKNSPEYIKTLSLLTGVMKDRLVDGLWVMAEGVIYDNFAPEYNVTDDAEYDPAREVIWGVDDGYAAGGGPGSANYRPRVILPGQVTAQGGIDIFNEYYATQELSERSVDNVLDWSYKEPDVAYVDSAAAELKGRIWDRGILSVGATHKVQEGIKNVRRLICDGQDVRLLRIHPRCVNLIRELQSYRYDDNSKVATVGEQKAKKIDDHGPDCLRYMTWHLRTG